MEGARGERRLDQGDRSEGLDRARLRYGAGRGRADQALSEKGALAETTGIKLAAVIATGSLYALAALLALLVVRPHLRPRKAKREAPQGLIYFGHLRRRSSHGVEDALEQLTAAQARADLARQLAALGQIGWRKHRLLQCSLNSLVLGTTALALARFAL